MSSKSLIAVDNLDISSSVDAGFFLIVIFPKNTSTQYSISVTISKLSKHYREGLIEGKLFHIAGFQQTNEDLSLAAGILKMVAGIKGAYAFLRGNLETELTPISNVLTCLKTSSFADNKAAYCQLPNALGVSILLPCRVISGFAYVLNKESIHSLKDQVQALSVSKGCDWCPNFNIENTKPL
ncbi:hypothetical protein [Rosenbergiella epipactidis]|uniref:hypothetical protein n=1 Tax=Rosenbergiella epipactidis TaxID=1544694 RepID=UPI001F4EB9EA|nr:hypothetical protein [Rosenbergiella epipactidis]